MGVSDQARRGFTAERVLRAREPARRRLLYLDAPATSK